MTKKFPTVSVIIPSYNREHLVGRAIKSVLDQTYQDFELIVIDDASTDNTEEVVKSFNDERIKYLKHDENKGGAAARNTGIKVARGEYIAFQDSDDEWLPVKLEKQMKVFEAASPEVGVVYTGFWRIESNKKIYIPSEKVARKEGNIHAELLRGNFVDTPTAVVKKDCFAKVGIFDERLPRRQDWELFIRISKCFYFKCIDEPLLISYYTPDSICTNQSSLIKALELILEIHYEDFQENKMTLSNHQYLLGNLLCQNGKMDRGKDCLLSALRLSPLNIKYLIATLVSLFGKRAYGIVVRWKHRSHR